MSIVGVLFLANMGAISIHRIQNAKEQELSIISDFCSHYMEQIRGLDFPALVPGAAINHLFNGDDGGPEIRIPADGQWRSIESEDFETFHPELVALANRELEMRVRLSTVIQNNVARSKHVAVEVRWNPPLGRGAQLSVRTDLMRYRDL